MLFLILNTPDEVLLIEKIYNKYSKFMFKVAYSILKDRYSAEDAVQQSFIKIINNISKIENIEDKKTRNFIGIICRNTAINLYNKSKKYSEIKEEDITKDYNYDISLLIISSESVEKIKNYIYSMDIKYQDVILLKAQNKYSTKEIADILNITPETARKRLERGRAKIKAFLAKEGK